jgi:catechol 2,3-dioxygenase-like lactoylglutathione lyase family enzyme
MIHFRRLDHLLITIPPGTRDQAREFYGRVLSLQEVPGSHPHDAIWYRMGDMELHLREEIGHIATSSRHPALEVENMEEAKAFLEKNEIAISYSSQIEGRERCFFRDPWGNRFELLDFNVRD